MITIALPRSTKHQFKYTDMTKNYSKANTFPAVSGACPSLPTNHKRMPCSPTKHNKTSFNGYMPPPSVQVSALSSRLPNEIFSSPGPTLPHKSIAGTYNLHLPPPKAISTNNDNDDANHPSKRLHQLPSPHELTPFTPRLSIPNNQPATPSVT